MEIAVLPQDGLKIKGKQGMLVIDALKQSADANASILLANATPEKTHTEEGNLVIQGPGSYEVSGIKITGMRHEGHLAYSFIIDRLNVLVGKASDLEKMHTKLSRSVKPLRIPRNPEPFLCNSSILSKLDASVSLIGINPPR